MTNPPSGYALEAAVSCFQSARARFEAAGDEEALAALGEATGNVEDMLARVARAIVDAEDMEAAAKVRAAAIKAREARFAARAEGLRGTLQAMMMAVSRTTLRLPDMTVSVTTPKRWVVITDAAALANEYVRTERTPIKTTIVADMVLGVVVAGAEWSNGLPGLRINTH